MKRNSLDREYDLLKAARELNASLRYESKETLALEAALAQYDPQPTLHVETASHSRLR